MKTNEVPYTICEDCGKPIYAGNLAVTFCRSIQQLDYTEECPDGEVTVADSQELISLCARCGNGFNVVEAATALKAALRRPKYSRN